mgnify:FL=1
MKTPIQSGGEAMPEETRDIDDACDVLTRIKSLNEVLFMAGEGMIDPEMKNAITTQCDVIDDFLCDVIAILEAHLEREARS